MRHLFFSIALTLASRALIRRDRRLGRPPELSAERGTGVIFSRHSIASGSNTVDAVFAQPRGRAATAHMLICHGIGETVEHWQAAQALLAENGVASLVFNYSGFGRSTGWITQRQCEADSVAAFHFLEQRAPSMPITLLGLSLGSGIAAAVAPRAKISKLILCGAFTSFRKAALSIRVPPWIVRLLPDIWNTEHALRSATVPVLIVHGEQDELFPVQMAADLAAACVAPCELILVSGLSHNGPIYEPEFAYWSQVIARF